MTTTPVQRLALCVTAIAVVWLLILPWMASRESISDRLNWLEDRGIDPSAMYYTELDAMKPILRKLEKR